MRHSFSSQVNLCSKGTHNLLLGEILHHQKDGWNPINSGMFTIYQLERSSSTSCPASPGFNGQDSVVEIPFTSLGPGHAPGMHQEAFLQPSSSSSSSSSSLLHHHHHPHHPHPILYGPRAPKGKLIGWAWIQYPIGICSAIGCSPTMKSRYCESHLNGPLISHFL